MTFYGYKAITDLRKYLSVLEGKYEKQENLTLF